ncbi:NADP-dependent oxidoreductase [Nocardia sp. NPDC004604]|uniref:NADP-dependent oxidoreductase n=1 Tax=Nocardia sp. NPDC004604 TaxID=3157013 RepID=UPI0033B9FA52
MKRIQYRQYGGPEVLRLDEVEVPKPGKRQLLVRVRAASANPADFVVRSGGLKLLTGRRFPRGLGHDFAGVVERLGDGVTRFKPGDAVFGGTMMRPAGAFAEWAVVDEKFTAKKPAEVSFEEAGAIATAGATGMSAVLKAAKLQAGQSVFITGCLGAVGRTAAQLALMRGAWVAGSCRDTAQADAEALGIDPVVGFDFDPIPFKGKFDFVVDTADALPLDVARSMLKPGGHMIDAALSPGKVVRSVFTRQYKPLMVPWDFKDLETLARVAVEGKISFPVARTVPLDQAIDALTELETRRTPKGGKLVITP